MEQLYNDYVNEQFSKLVDHDHELFAGVVKGLVKEGWILDGGSKTFALLCNGYSSIKVFRSPECPEVIKICFSAPPEEDMR